MADPRDLLQVLSSRLNVLRQNALLEEGAFIRFARDRGLAVGGLVTGEPGDFVRKGWLACDGTDQVGRPLFHPFRLYPLFRIMKRCEAIKIPPAAWLLPDRLLEGLRSAGDRG